MRSPTRALALLCLAALGSACASVGRPLVAKPDDYAAWRATRVGATPDERLAAAWRYLEEHPRGAYREEVSGWFERAEPLFYEARQGSLTGTRAYLAALPSGPHAAEAIARIRAFEHTVRADRGEHLAAAGATIERRLAAAADARAAVQEAYTSWVGRFVGLASWGERTHEADGEFLYALRIEPPVARCTGRVCRKIFSLPYSVQLAGRPESLVATMEVDVTLVDGGLREVSLAGPELFSRLAEAHEARAMAASSSGDRVAAIAWAVELTAGALEGKLPAARCAREPVAPVVLSRACDGWTVELFAASRPGEDDRLVVRGPSR